MLLLLLFFWECEQQLDPIWVPRTPADRARLPSVTAAIQAQVGRPQGRRVLIFPEGTTVAQQAMIAFQMGAFRPGVPVQPVVIGYPFRHHDVSWTPDYSALMLLWRTCCQVVNFMHVQYLPIVHCNGQHPTVFRAMVQEAMQRASGRRVSAATVHDKLLFSSLRRVAPALATYALTALFPVMETGEAQRSAALTLPALTQLAVRFYDADDDNKGLLTEQQFQGLLRGAPCALLFQLLDTDKDGFLNWRDIVLGSTPGAHCAMPVTVLQPVFAETLRQQQFEAMPYNSSERWKAMWA